MLQFQKRVPERAKIKKKEKSEGSWWWPWGGSQESEEEIETPDKDGRLDKSCFPGKQFQ